MKHLRRFWTWLRYYSVRRRFYRMSLNVIDGDELPRADSASLIERYGESFGLGDGVTAFVVVCKNANVKPPHFYIALQFDPDSPLVDELNDGSVARVVDATIGALRKLSDGMVNFPKLETILRRGSEIAYFRHPLPDTHPVMHHWQVDPYLNPYLRN